MKNVKKSMLWLLIAYLLTSLAACGGKENDGDGGKEPVIFYSGNTVVQGGDTVSVRGEYLDTVRKATMSDGKKSQDVTLKQQDSQSFTVQIPEGFEAGVYTLTLAGDRKTEIRFNVPKVRWIQGDEGETATSNGWIRLQGECLQITKEAECSVVLTGADGKETKLAASCVYDAYSAAFALEQLPPGTYQVSYSNGYAACECGSITIAPAPKEEYSQTVYNVLDYGLSNRGVEDATKALQKLLTEVGEQGGGIVYFPGGRYRLMDAIHVPKGVTLLGDGYTDTQLYWADDNWTIKGQYDEEAGKITHSRWPGEPPEYMITVEGDCAFAGIDFSAGRIGSWFKAGSAENPVCNIRIEQVRVSSNPLSGGAYSHHPAWTRASIKAAWTRTLFDITGENIKIQDCEFYWPGALFDEDQQIRYLVMQNIMFGDTYALSSKMPVGMVEKAILEDMTMSGYSLAVGGSDIYMARMEFSNIVYGERKAISTRMSGGISYTGAVQAADTQIIFPEDTDMRKALRGYQVCILSGTGAGQHREIAEVNGNVVTLTESFAAAPDETSQVTILPLYENWYLNDIQVDNCGMLELTAALCNIVVDRVEVIGSAGILSRAEYSYGSAQVKWYQSFVNHTFSEGNSVYYVDGWYDGHAGGIAEAKELPGYSFLYVDVTDSSEYAIGTVLRGNSLRDNCLLYIRGGEQSRLLDMVIDSNHSEDCLCGIYMVGDPEKLTISGNTFERVGIEQEVRCQAE